MITVVTPPDGYPVTHKQLSDHLRLNGLPDEDSQPHLIQMALAGATAGIEEYTGQSFVQRDLSMEFEGFCSEMQLLRGPVLSITSVTYTDEDGNSQTLSTDAYTLFSASYMPYLKVTDIPAYDENKPVIVNYSAGKTNIPADIQSAILLLAADLYENREATGDFTARTFENSVYSRILDPHRVPRLAL